MTVDPLQYARRWKTLAVLSLSLVIIGLDNTILNVALPTLQDEFDASPSKLQWMVDSYLLVFAGLLLVFGTLGDRFGRKLALQAGVSIFGLASLGALIADSANEVIAVRAAMGVGAALIMHWNTVPTKLQRELFDCACGIGDPQQTTPLKGQIARFLHDHKDDAPKAD